MTLYGAFSGGETPSKRTKTPVRRAFDATGPTCPVATRGTATDSVRCGIAGVARNGPFREVLFARTTRTGMRRPAVVCTFVVLLFLAGCAGLGLEPGTQSRADTVDGEPTASGTAAETLNATVVRIVDGDTVEVRLRNGTTDTVRLLGVDTPEVHVENEPGEFEGVPDTDEGAACLRSAGQRAGNALRDRVAGERVRLVVDATADRRGGYGRLLAYLELDGADLNRWLVAEGHARVYDSTFARSDDYYDAESRARDENLGLWTCRTP